jgi:putative hemolysin
MNYRQMARDVTKAMEHISVRITEIDQRMAEARRAGNLDELVFLRRAMRGVHAELTSLNEKRQQVKDAAMAAERLRRKDGNRTWVIIAVAVAALACTYGATSVSSLVWNVTNAVDFKKLTQDATETMATMANDAYAFCTSAVGNMTNAVDFKELIQDATDTMATMANDVYAICSSAVGNMARIVEEL